MLRANLYLDSLADRKNEVQRRRRKKRIGKKREDTCLDVRCLARLSLEASCIPAPLYPTYPSYAKPTLLLHIAVDAMKVRHISLFWRTCERSQKKKKRKRYRELWSYATGESTAAVSKTKSRSTQQLLSSPRLEILVFNDRPMGWEDRCVMCRSFS